MKRFTQKKFRLSAVAILSTFLMLGSSAHSEALDLGPKAKYIISINPSARAAIETAITNAGGKIDKKYSYVFDGYTVELPSLIVAVVKRFLISCHLNLIKLLLVWQFKITKHQLHLGA